MFLVYTPEGSEEPKRWRYDPRKMMSPERENIERLTGLTWSEFTQAVVKGSSICRRALLFTFLKRDHPGPGGPKFDDVNFAWEELTLEYSKGELIKLREVAAEAATAEQRPVILANFDEQIEAAVEDPEEQGKARPPVAE